MKLHIEYFLLLTLVSIGEGFAKNGCSDILRELADLQMRFVQCFTASSNPAASCRKCYLQQKSMVEKYDQLVANCSEEYLNQNRLNVVYTMEKSLTDIWNKGFCYDCFENGGLSNATIEFNELSTRFDNCLGQFIKLNPCNNCNTEYVDLNDFYREMDEEKKGKICFDLQDKMNQTRSKWSRDLKCCRREYSLLLFLIGSSFFCALPVIFYLGMYGYTKRMERNHEVIDSTFGTVNQEPGPSICSAASSSAIVPNNQPTTSTGRSSPPEENLKKIKAQLNNTASEVHLPKKQESNLINI